MFSHTPLDVLWFLEDPNHNGIPGPQDDTELTDSITIRDVSEADLQFSERTCDVTYSLEPPQNGTLTGYKNIKGITLEDQPPTSSKNQPQEARIASTNHRRVWKWVRRQISSSCCPPTPKKGDTTSR